METATQSIARPAGFWIRFGAIILDGLIVALPLGVLTFLLTGDVEGNTAVNFFTNSISFLYSVLLPVFWYGYTIGKKLLGIRIVKINGEKLGIGTMFLRVVVGALVYGVTLGIAAIVSAFMVALRQDKRSIHDLIAGTYVTYEKPEI